MFAIDKRKLEVRDRMERNDWEDFDLNDMGLFTLIYEMDQGESVKIFDDRERHLNVIKKEDGLVIAHEDFVMQRAYLETVSGMAQFRNDHVKVTLSLVRSKVIDFVISEEDGDC